MLNFLKNMFTDTSSTASSHREHFANYGTNHYEVIEYLKNRHVLSDKQWRMIYEIIPFAKKGITIPLADAMHVGRTIQFDDGLSEDIQEDILKKFKLCDDIIHQLLLAGSVFGFAVGLIILDDENLEQPINYNRLDFESFKNIVIYNNENIKVEEVETDINSIRYRQPLYYTLRDMNGSRKVHYTRCLEAYGDQVLPINNMGDNVFSSNNNPHISSLLKVKDSLLRNDDFTKNIDKVMYKQLIDVVKIDDLYEATCGVGKNANRRLNTDNLPNYFAETKKHIKSDDIMLLDSKNDFERYPYAWGGVKDVSNKLAEEVAALFDIPIDRFMSRNLATLNTSGNSLDYYDKNISNIQNTKLDKLYVMLDLIFFSMYNIKYTFKFNSILEPTETDKAKLQGEYIKNAQIMASTGIVKGESIIDYLSINNVNVEYDEIQNIAEEGFNNEEF